MTLALLLTAVTGAWATDDVILKELTVPSEWNNDKTYLTVDEMTGFKDCSSLTEDEAKALLNSVPTGNVVIFYGAGASSNSIKFVQHSGDDVDVADNPVTHDDVFYIKNDFKFYYTAEPAITSPLLGREITASELNAAVEQLTQYARKNYPAAIAYIPEQTAREGKLLIRFEPGRFDKVQIEAGSVLKESVAHRPLAGLKKGRIIEAGSLEESLRNLRDIPGIAAHATLSPGSEQGTSNLTIKVTDLHPATYILYGENYGSKSAGRYRYGASRQTGRISAAPAAA